MSDSYPSDRNSEGDKLLNKTRSDTDAARKTNPASDEDIELENEFYGKDVAGGNNGNQGGDDDAVRINVSFLIIHKLPTDKFYGFLTLISLI